MNRHYLLLPAVVLALAPAAHAADGTFDKSLTFSGTPVLSVSTGAGYIHVYPGPDNQVHVIGRVHVHGGWMASDSEAEARVRQIVASPPIVQAGNILTIGKSNSDLELFRNVSIDYDVTAPAATMLKARSGSGSLEIGGIIGEVNAGTGSGGINADNIGANSRFEAGSGSIRATHIRGGVFAETGSGQIEISTTAPGDVQAHTGSGGMHLAGIVGGVRATAGSGSIDIEGTPQAEWRLESGSGGIHVEIGASAHFNLDASTGSGSVSVDRPIVMQGNLSRHHVVGSVNGGGPALRASTGSGSITIR